MTCNSTTSGWRLFCFDYGSALSWLGSRASRPADVLTSTPLSTSGTAGLPLRDANSTLRHLVSHGPAACRWRMCFLDEHYIPSLLAFHGLDDETDCRGGLVTANWTLPGAKHPVEYSPAQIRPQLCAPIPWLHLETTTRVLCCSSCSSPPDKLHILSYCACACWQPGCGQTAEWQIRHCRAAAGLVMWDRPGPTTSKAMDCRSSWCEAFRWSMRVVPQVQAVAGGRVLWAAA